MVSWTCIQNHNLPLQSFPALLSLIAQEKVPLSTPSRLRKKDGIQPFPLLNKHLCPLSIWFFLHSHYWPICSYSWPGFFTSPQLIWSSTPCDYVSALLKNSSCSRDKYQISPMALHNVTPLICQHLGSLPFLHVPVCSGSALSMSTFTVLLSETHFSQYYHCPNQYHSFCQFKYKHLRSLSLMQTSLCPLVCAAVITFFQSLHMWVAL